MKTVFNTFCLVARLRSIRAMLCIALTAVSAIGQSAIIKFDSKATGANTGLTWADAVTNVQDAVAMAGEGEVWFKQGVHLVCTNLNQTVTLSQSVKLYGGFPGLDDAETLADRDPVNCRTILTGDIGGNNSWVDINGKYIYVDGKTIPVVKTDGTFRMPDDSQFFWGVTGVVANDVMKMFTCGDAAVFATPAIVDGLSFTGGRECVFYGTSATPMTFTNCTFVGSNSPISVGAPVTVVDCGFYGTGETCLTWRDGGLANQKSSLTTASPISTVQNCSFLYNRGTYALAVWNVSGGPVVFRDNVVRRNVSSRNLGGAAIAELGGSPRAAASIINCVFSENTTTNGSAILQWQYASAIVSNSVFVGNAIVSPFATGTYTATINLGNVSPCVIANCAFVSNRVTRTGIASGTTRDAISGIRFNGWSGNLQNCTFFGNSASASGDGTALGATVMTTGGFGLNVRYCTFSENMTTTAEFISHDVPGKLQSVLDCIFWNTATGYVPFAPTGTTDTNGQLAIYNTIAKNFVSAAWIKTTVDVTTANPLLKSSVRCEGTRAWIPPQAGTPARNAGLDVVLDAAGRYAFNTAARGSTPVWLRCDTLGAYTPTAPLTYIGDVVDVERPVGRATLGAYQTLPDAATVIALR